MGKVAILGLGLIGGSLGLAIKRAQPADTTVIGYDRDWDVAVRAHKAGAVQQLAETAEEAVKEATLVIIATPILSVRRILETIAPVVRPGTVITDVASTKGDVLRWARALPPRVYFVGGHPMAGKETSGPESADEKLFDGRPYCIVPSPDAHPGAVQAVVGLAQVVGAEPFFLDADEHDAYAAAISHIPLVASIALFRLARGSTAWPELASMSGPAFKDLTRLASGTPEMTHDIFMTNKDNLVHWLDRYMVELKKLSDSIKDGEAETMFREVAETQIERETWLTAPPRRAVPGEMSAMPASFDSFMTMLGGALWTNRAKDITDTLEERGKERERERRLTRHDDD